ncbi:hypothetical protein [Candidatus Cytomitobacter primus]|uniref:Uncharacterized protein n=1 Tax=Candidatus Cytomitobacter primus TaxID=2066024 RepID=A0A5C0UEA8_9PROT|nr:hypothetical protein [Candidatus Cytomitobacter primus]QEK38425.1 hypothetical protein FZC34_00630 [Candidatus Cytomitobacter primus]
MSIDNNNENSEIKFDSFEIEGNSKVTVDSEDTSSVVTIDSEDTSSVATVDSEVAVGSEEDSSESNDTENSDNS